GYLAQYHTNEQQLLDSLTQRDLARVIYRDPEQRYVIYDVRAVRMTGEAGESHPPVPLHRQTNLLCTSISGRWRGTGGEDQCRVT
ncbi:MAG: hypothetical protein LC793_10485, partial [Thermomicrobia bacterium]|nr:hypothetical protein [Thermomicrobia bacterium]